MAPIGPQDAPAPAASAAADGDVNDPCYCEKLECALRQAALVFGEPVVEALVTALRDQYGIRIGPGRLPCSSLQEVEVALAEIAGSGAEILAKRMRHLMMAADEKR
jgi:hypothetical protein